MAQQPHVTLDIEGDMPDEPESSSNTNLLRTEAGARTAAAARPIPPPRPSVGLGDRLNSVFREIRPLVEHARMLGENRPNSFQRNNARLSLPTWLPRNPPANQAESSPQRPQSSIAHVNLGPSSQTFVVNDRGVSPAQRGQSQMLSTSVSNDSNLSDPPQDHQEINISVNPANNNNIHDNADNDSQSEDGTQQVLDIRGTLNLLIKYAPFYFLLFIKMIYDMREGLFTFLILFCTFSYSNSLVRREHGKQMNRSIGALLFELIKTISCIIIVHYLFGHDKLLQNLIMFPAYTEPIDVWELLWLVVMTDLMVKIITVDIKIVVTMMPAVILPFQKRGKVYLFVEAVSQLYRSLITIQPWIFYLMQSYEGSEKMVGMFLTSIYVIAKVVEILLRLKLFKNATRTLLQSVNLGTKPTGEQLLSAGDSCPICHDDYTTPVRLGCSHIFCELCISAWLDREHTCPLCRAKVADEPTWRDGSTTHDFQLY